MKVTGAVKSSSSESTSAPRSEGRLEELQQQAVDLVRLLLLHPMAGAFDKVDLLHLRAGGLLHALEGTWRLMDAPVARTGDEGRGHVDGTPREQLELRVEAAAGAHAIPLQPALEAVARVLVAVDPEFRIGQPFIAGDLGGRRHLLGHRL